MILKRFILLSVILFNLIQINYSNSIEPDVFVQSTVNRASKLLSENITKEEKQEYRDTKCMFGLAKKLQEKFPFAHQFSISVHPPGALINFHKDTDDYLKVHIPILTNKKAYFTFEPNRKYVLPADGHMTLINTSIPHGTHNEGETDRVHLFFKIPKDKEMELLKYKEDIL